MQAAWSFKHRCLKPSFRWGLGRGEGLCSCQSLYRCPWSLAITSLGQKLLSSYQSGSQRLPVRELASDLPLRPKAKRCYLGGWTSYQWRMRLFWVTCIGTILIWWGGAPAGPAGRGQQGDSQIYLCLGAGMDAGVTSLSTLQQEG